MPTHDQEPLRHPSLADAPSSEETGRIIGRSSQPPGREQPLVTAVIPVKDGEDELRRCLRALSASDLDHGTLEILVVDDGSTDGSAEVAREFGARVLQFEQNHGPAFARNRGAEAASGRLLFFCDADVAVHEDTVATAIRCFERDPDLGAVIGSYDDRPGDTHFISQFKNLFHRWVHQHGHEEASTFWTGCGAIRRELFLAHGGFDESFARPSIEDIELGFRLRSEGARIRLEKEMQAKHLKRWRLLNLLRTDLFLRGAPWVALMLRDRHLSADLNLSTGSKLATVLSLLLVATLAALPLAGHAAALLPFATWMLMAPIAAGVVTRFGSERTPRLPDLSFTGLAVGICLAVFSLVADPFALLPLALLGAMMGTHLSLHADFIRSRGLTFVIAAAPMQLLYQLCCALSIPFGILAHLRSEPALVPAARTPAEEARA